MKNQKHLQPFQATMEQEDLDLLFGNTFNKFFIYAKHEATVAPETGSNSARPIQKPAKRNLSLILILKFHLALEQMKRFRILVHQNPF